MSIKILDAVKNSLYSQLFVYLKHGYNFKIKTALEGQNALMIALTIPDIEKRFKMLEFLLSQDCINVLDADKNGRNVFFWAVTKQCIRELEVLMKQYHMEIDWSYTDNTGKTLLHYGVLTNNVFIVSILLKYCAKYKINIDIPDKKDKITPYLLASRLNYIRIADLLLNIGRASKNQCDENVHFNAFKWQEEGKLEKFESYLKNKKQEMNIAKLNGQIIKYKELNKMSKSLDYEVNRNPQILPVLAKALVEHEEHCFAESNTNKMNNLSIIDDNMNIEENSYTAIPQSLNSTNNVNINTIIQNKMNSIINTNRSLPEVNSLLEMTKGDLVENFVASKSDSDLNNASKHSSHSNSMNHFGIADMFQIAAYQQSGNYRAPAKILPIKQKQKTQQKQKIKTGLSTLAIIREESRLSMKRKSIVKQPNKLKFNSIKTNKNYDMNKSQVINS